MCYDFVIKFRNKQNSTLALHALVNKQLPVHMGRTRFASRDSSSPIHVYRLMTRCSSSSMCRVGR